VSQFEAVAWEGRSIDEWRELWQLPRLIVLTRTDSTNVVVRRLADTGAPAGTVVMAEHQTRGRGRMGRHWIDRPGASLLCSILLRPKRIDATAPGTAPLRVGLAVAAALRAAAGIDARLKWPNDVVWHGRKVAGILCEAATTGGDTFVVAGIGINVHQRGSDFAGPLQQSAVSVDMAAGTTIGRSLIMGALVAAIRPSFTKPLAPLDDHERADFAALDTLADRVVETSDPAYPRGLARGVSADGALVLEHDGRTALIASATVRIAPTSTGTHA
jgi:BirA family transcriptional regulator, biotin operon repressor / biotin---[acetyl-CoA-carboxylase] ligase